MSRIKLYCVCKLNEITTEIIAAFDNKITCVHFYMNEVEDDDAFCAVLMAENAWIESETDSDFRSSI